MRPTSVPMAGRIQSHSTAAESRTKTNSNSRNRPKRISGKTASKNARFLRVLHFERNTRLDSATNQRLTLRHLNDCVSRRSIRARIAAAEASLDRPCANQGAQRHAREFVVGGLVHEDDRQDGRAARLMDVRDRRLDRVPRRNDVVDDEDFPALRRCVVAGECAAFAMALFAIAFTSFMRSPPPPRTMRDARYQDIGLTRGLFRSRRVVPSTTRPSLAFPVR